jgi:hypothetical protein
MKRFVFFILLPISVFFDIIYISLRALWWAKTLPIEIGVDHQHVDVKVHFLRDLVRDGHVKLLKCAGPQNFSDALTKSLPRPAFEKHRKVSLLWPMSLSYLFLCILSSVLSLIVRADKYSSTRGRAKWHDAKLSVHGLEPQMCRLRGFSSSALKFN